MEKSLQGCRGINTKWVLGLIVLVSLLLICPLQEAEGSVQHQIGGTPGWTLPSVANLNYTTWASTQTFSVGDTLYFNYSKASHDVLQVTEANYDNCVTSSPMGQWDDGETVILLNVTGNLYYICGKTGHCGLGQKVAVLVEAGSNSTSSNNTSISPLSLSTSALSPLSILLAFSLISILV